MSAVTRPSNPLSELIGWLEGDTTSSKSFGLMPHVRIEDFTENGEYVLRAEMPGIDPEKDVQVQVDGNVLTIRGERTEEEKSKNRHEFHYGSFSRAITLPSGARADEVRASYSDRRASRLRVPIEGRRAEPRTIPIQRTEA